MSDQPVYRPRSDKALVHIPGAGAMGMAILLVSLSMLFVSSMIGYLVKRHQIMAEQHSPTWPPPGLPEVPASLWFSTLVIIASSVTIQLAVNAIRRDNERKLLTFLRITFGLGCLFLVLQAINWFEFYRAIPATMRIEGLYLGMFYVLTGLHAAHVIGGLVPLVVVMIFARKGRYSRNFHPGVRYATLYWHFLDIVWVILFALLLL